MKDIIQIFLLLVIIGAIAWQRKPASMLPTTRKSRKIIMDTCALIDGRIIELAQSGFVPEVLIVPEFVLHELQMLADGADAHKRERARFGLDVVKELQDMADTEVVIDHTQYERQPNDDKLVLLAQKTGAALYTTDFNLNKLADIKGVKVLNVNELAQNLRPVALPGERKTVKILQKGSNPKQGVGYLEDGTMVVVDNAARMVDRTVEIEISRTHQTVAGKMLFATLITQPPKQSSNSGSHSSAQKPATPPPTKQRSSGVRDRFRRKKTAVIS
jgi:uncharacterized protein YacL